MAPRLDWMIFVRTSYCEIVKTAVYLYNWPLVPSQRASWLARYYVFYGFALHKHILYAHRWTVPGMRIGCAYVGWRRVISILFFHSVSLSYLGIHSKTELLKTNYSVEDNSGLQHAKGVALPIWFADGFTNELGHTYSSSLRRD